MATQLDLPDKFCTKCSTAKPRSDFSERWQKAGCVDAYRASNAYCKQCSAALAKARHHSDTEKSNARSRKSKLKTAYGLTLDDYDRMLTEQNGNCAICASRVPGGRGRFHVDHCHTTGRVRGLLCCNCNRGIGALRDDPDLLRKAIGYLEVRR